MPNYTFENLKTKEIQVFNFSLDNHPTWGEVREIDGQKWKRIMETHAPMGIVKDTINPHSSEAFVDETKRKKGTVGDLIERSQELSEQRKKQSIDGRDSVKDKFLDGWSKKRGGKKHPTDDR